MAAGWTSGQWRTLQRMRSSALPRLGTACGTGPPSTSPGPLCFSDMRSAFMPQVFFYTFKNKRKMKENIYVTHFPFIYTITAPPLAHSGHFVQVVGRAWRLVPEQ